MSAVFSHGGHTKASTLPSRVGRYSAGGMIGLAAMIVTAALAAPAPLAAQAGPTEYREWIERMKTAERGPFSRVLWYCSDGTTQPPVMDGCQDHGGGRQHGEWNQEAKALRAAGYQIANLLSAIDAEEFVASDGFAEAYAQVLIEKFLIGFDDGWILRRAMFYRGAIQEEGERRGGRRLLERMVSDDDWIGLGYLPLRVGVQLLPHGADNPSIVKVRQVSAALSDRDPGFRSIRLKIHGAPDGGDAEQVRTYAAGLPKGPERQEFEDLAREIDAIYQPTPLDETLLEHARRYDQGPWLQDMLRATSEELRSAPTAAAGFAASGALLEQLRLALPRVRSKSVRLELLDLSLRAESEHFRAATELRPRLNELTRSEHLELMDGSLRAAFGAGLLNARLFGQALGELSGLIGGKEPSLHAYRDTLTYLGRAPAWGSQALRMHFNEAMLKLAEIEPLALLFIQDQLRGSPLFFQTQLLDPLVRDANRMAGVSHRLFDREIGTGLAALNPGLARGVLHVDADPSHPERMRADGIYVLAETVAELPPVGGILTSGEGNPLSHVQLLARNLGIPNVAVAESLLPELAAQAGREVVLAVSAGGVVEIAPADTRWDAVFAEADRSASLVIRPDLDKLDLGVRELVPLMGLGAGDSGRIVGPKAAQLGELRARYPDAVARGLAIPFGVFSEEVLQRPHPGGSADAAQTVQAWMLQAYRALQALPAGSPERGSRTEVLREELHRTVLDTVPSTQFRENLRRELASLFEGEAVPGLFIRSDTNVEDLPGFTGAGLNLTLPNVAGFDALIEGIPRVWASPFTARAFAWRQALMESPEHVYTSILLLESVPVEKSGVLVTQDLDSGDRGVISVAVNEGLGGAVDGQAAESLRIDMGNGQVRVLATATAPWRRVLNPEGGLEKVRVSGADTVLRDDEIERLIAFVRDLPSTFPGLLDDQGEPAAADVEFGFANGRLRLFQIRPFLESRQARGSGYLREMDSALTPGQDVRVDLSEAPRP